MRLLSPASSAEADAGQVIPHEELSLGNLEMLAACPFGSLLAGHLCPTLLNEAVSASPGFLPL